MVQWDVDHKLLLPSRHSGFAIYDPGNQRYKSWSSAPAHTRLGLAWDERPSTLPESNHTHAHITSTWLGPDQPPAWTLARCPAPMEHLLERRLSAMCCGPGWRNVPGQQQITVWRYVQGRYLFVPLWFCVQVCLCSACVSLYDRGKSMCKALQGCVSTCECVFSKHDIVHRTLCVCRHGRVYVENRLKKMCLCASMWIFHASVWLCSQYGQCWR